MGVTMSMGFHQRQLMWQSVRISGVVLCMSNLTDLVLSAAGGTNGSGMTMKRTLANQERYVPTTPR